jgi:ribonucleoside-triphosphate reductase
MMSNIVVIKRDGSEVPYDRTKIIRAISKALIELDGNLWQGYIAENIAASLESYMNLYGIECITVEEIQDLVENFLMEGPRPELAKKYIRYRYKRELARNNYKDLMDTVGEKLSAANVQNQNANVDEYSFGGRMGEMNSAVARKYALEYLVSPMARKNHEENMIYIHDLDNYAVGSHNCLTIPFDDLLAKGFNTRQTDVRPAQSVSTAFQLVAVIFQLQSLQQFGGVSASHIDWTMVPYVRKSFYKHFKDGLSFIENVKFVENDHVDNIPESALKDVNRQYLNRSTKRIITDSEGYYYDNFPIDCCYEEDYPKAYKYALEMTEREIYQAVEAMYHNLNTLQSRSGNQLK